MTWYLGPVGSLLAIKTPAPGTDPALPKRLVTKTLLGGGQVAQQIGRPRRTYTLKWPSMSDADFAVLEGLYLGAYGPGPYALMDPQRTNLLTANQSSGTDVLLDTTGFSGFNATLSSVTSNNITGQRSLQWLFPASAALGSAVRVTKSTSASGDLLNDVPVLASRTYTAQVSVAKVASVDALTLGLRIRWYDGAGNSTGSDAAASYAVPDGTQTLLTVSGVSPFNAYACRVILDNETATTVSTQIFTDAWQLEKSTSASAWTLGTGLPRVSFADLQAGYYMPGLRTDVSATLVEVG